MFRFPHESRCGKWRERDCAGVRYFPANAFWELCEIEFRHLYHLAHHPFQSGRILHPFGEILCRYCGTEKRRENLRSRMSKPKRIQRSRAKGWKMPANAIYVGRPTVWGNPYVVGSELMNGETLTAEKAVALYEQHLADNFSERDIRHCLHDKDLACWCALDEPCHADVLLRIANSRPK